MDKPVLSERMQAIEDMVLPGLPVADVGTDHGIIPADILLKGICPYAVLIDINSGPLEKCRENLKAFGVDPSMFSILQGDGFDPIGDGVFGTVITAGMGGGTGTGAAPFVARVAKELGILTVGIVTKPFAFEGSRKMSQAEQGIEELLQEVDALIVIPNERLKLVTDAKITLANAFEMADGILKQGVQSITELIQGHGFINLDFADVTSNMKDAGYAHMCVASAKGKDKAETAARNAITSPLLETSIAGARKILLNFTADSNIDLEDIYRAADIIKEEAHPDVDIIWGVILDDSLQDELRIAVIASCFDESVAASSAKKQAASASSDSFFNIPAAPKTENTTATPAASNPETEFEPIQAVRQPRTGSVQRPNGNERPSARRASSSVVDDDDANDSFLKLLNDITKSK